VDVIDYSITLFSLPPLLPLPYLLDPSSHPSSHSFTPHFRARVQWEVLSCSGTIQARSFCCCPLSKTHAPFFLLTPPLRPFPFHPPPPPPPPPPPACP
ncbi:unnamed protein product, partial [Closterium sp. NIES-54]